MIYCKKKNSNRPEIELLKDRSKEGLRDNTWSKDQTIRMWNTYKNKNIKNKKNKLQDNEANHSQRNFEIRLKSNIWKKQRPAENFNINDLYEHFKTLYSTDLDHQIPEIDTDLHDEDIEKEIQLSYIKKAIFRQKKSSSIDTALIQ